NGIYDPLNNSKNVIYDPVNDDDENRIYDPENDYENGIYDLSENEIYISTDTGELGLLLVDREDPFQLPTS
ncbi:6126_t:CDS:2, partial [Funneliformis geosporum]